MKKIFLTLMLMSALVLNAQTSRFFVGIGGGLSSTISSNNAHNVAKPMATFNMGYSIMSSNESNLKLGFRTGLNLGIVNYEGYRAINDSYTNYDYLNNRIEYTVTSPQVDYTQKQLNIELPMMFALAYNGFGFNLGAKFILPISNTYEQTIAAPSIDAYYTNIDVILSNDIVTGMLTNEQCNQSADATTAELMVALSMEIGYYWLLNNGNTLGFDIFVDYIPVHFGKADNDKMLIDVAPIVNNGKRQQADVTVYPLNECYNYDPTSLVAGVKLIYGF